MNPGLANDHTEELEQTVGFAFGNVDVLDSNISSPYISREQLAFFRTRVRTLGDQSIVASFDTAISTRCLTTLNVSLSLTMGSGFP